MGNMGSGGRRAFVWIVLIGAAAGVAGTIPALLDDDDEDRRDSDRRAADGKRAPAADDHRPSAPEPPPVERDDDGPPPLGSDLTPEQFEQAIPRWSNEFGALLETLRQTQDPGELSRLAREMERYARTLGPRMGDPARRSMVALLRNVQRGDILRRVGTSLAYGGANKEAALAVLALLDDGQRVPGRDFAIAAALSGVGDTATAKALLGRIDGGRREGAVHLIRAIGVHRDDDVERDLLMLLDAKIPGGVRVAIERVWGVGGKDADVTAILDRVDAATGPAQASMVRILGNTANPSHIEKVRAVWDRTQDRIVQREVLNAMGRIGDEGSVEFIVQVATETGPLAHFAAQSLHLLRKPEAVVSAARQWERLPATGRAALLRATRHLDSKTEEVIGIATLALDDKDAVVRSNGLLLLGQPGRAAALDPIAERLKESKNERECLAAVQALLAIATPEAHAMAADAIDKLPKAMRESYAERVERAQATDQRK